MSCKHESHDESRDEKGDRCATKTTRYKPQAAHRRIRMNDMDMGRGGIEMDEIQHRTHKPRHTKMMDHTLVTW